MPPTNLQLIAGFLLKEHDRFEAYLSSMDIDELESWIITEDFVNNTAYPDGAPCSEKFSGFIGE